MVEVQVRQDHVVDVVAAHAGALDRGADPIVCQAVDGAIPGVELVAAAGFDQHAMRAFFTRAFGQVDVVGAALQQQAVVSHRDAA